MSQHLFTDDGKQLIVRLDGDSLSYEPADGRGWRCRTEDICWTSAEIDGKGVHVVRLHAADGRVVASIPDFDQIERFYVLLVRHLAARPFFDPVRPRLPGQVGRLERLLWLANETQEADGAWEALDVTDQSAAVATRSGLIVMPTPVRRLERIPWTELAGFATRGEVTRFYRSDSYVEAVLPDVEAALDGSFVRHRKELEEQGSARPTYRLPGAECADDAVAMSFSWEIEQAVADRLLREGESICACAVGAGHGSIVPPPAGPPTGPGFLESVMPSRTNDHGLRTELLLTSQRLLQVERDLTGALVGHVETDLDRLPRARCEGPVLYIESFELRTEPRRPMDVAGEFLIRYRRSAQELLDPFASEEPGMVIPPHDPYRVRGRRLDDPFSVDDREPTGR